MKKIELHNQYLKRGKTCFIFAILIVILIQAVLGLQTKIMGSGNNAASGNDAWYSNSY